MVEPAEIETLVERARAGDLAAFGRLATATSAMVRGVARRELGDPDLAEDSVQETYLRAFRRLDRLREARAFPGWIGRMALTVARDMARRRRPTFVDPVCLDRLVLETAPLDEDPGGPALDRLLAGLPVADRRLVDRYYRGGWTTSRLAREQGISEAAVRKRLQRLRDRMRKEASMTDEMDDLPARIVELLARPRLTDLPENPVGEVWAAIRAARPKDDVVELPERLEREVAEAISGSAGEPLARTRAIEVGSGTILRYDQTVPLLLAARGRPSGARLLAAGKVYRDTPEGPDRLAAFHQAEVLWIGSGLTVFRLVEWLLPLFHDLLPGRVMRLEECEFAPAMVEGLEVQVGRGGEWTEIGGLARFTDDTVRWLGHDPGEVRAVGAGLGLERIAALRHGVTDLRHLATFGR